MSIIKCLFFTDTHYTFKKPISRIETVDYLDTQIEKTKEIFEIGKSNNVDFYIHGGDFFDSPDISDSVAGTIGKLYTTVEKPVYVVAGNHDLVGNNIATIFQTKLGLLAQLGIVKLLNRYEPVFIEKDGIKLQITASPSNFGIDEEKDAYIVTEKNADFALHVVHAMLIKGDVKFGSYMPLDSIVDSTLADVTLSGHYHLGFRTTYYKNKIFANPGAVMRKTALLEEYERMPKVDIITFDSETKKASIEEIPISCAKPGYMVIDRNKLETEKEHADKIVDFRMSLLNKSFAISVDLNKIVEAIQKEEELEDDVVKEVIKRLDEAKLTINESEESNE